MTGCFVNGALVISTTDLIKRFPNPTWEIFVWVLLIMILALFNTVFVVLMEEPEV
jgi:uncharacterized membrane protein